MNKIEDEDFKRNWEEVSTEKQQLDARSDERILKGIERKIKPSVNIRKIYWAAAAVVILGVGLYFSDSRLQLNMKLTYSSVPITAKSNLTGW